MLRFRSLIMGTSRVKTVLGNIQTPARLQRFGNHDDGPPQPFDNLPFSIPNRYAATAVFSIFFGIGFWAPFLIVWYSMAKRTL